MNKHNQTNLPIGGLTRQQFDHLPTGSRITNTYTGALYEVTGRIQQGQSVLALVGVNLANNNPVRLVYHTHYVASSPRPNTQVAA
jgi:hypothetical protein